MRIIYEFENVGEYLEYINMNAHASKNKHEQTNINIKTGLDQENANSIMLKLESILQDRINRASISK